MRRGILSYARVCGVGCGWFGQGKAFPFAFTFSPFQLVALHWVGLGLLTFACMVLGGLFWCGKTANVLAYMCAENRMGIMRVF